MGRRLGRGEPLFSTVKSVIGKGKTGEIVPMTEQRVQHMVRELADRTGLDPRVPGKITYRIRPDEIGRDFFRTLCEKAEVPSSIAEYSLGHKMDALEYNKFYNTEEGRAKVQTSLEKVRPLVNVISGKGTPAQTRESYFDEASRQLAVAKGKSLEEVREILLLEALAMGKLAKAVKDEKGITHYSGRDVGSTKANHHSKEAQAEGHRRRPTTAIHRCRVEFPE